MSKYQRSPFLTILLLISAVMVLSSCQRDAGATEDPLSAQILETAEEGLSTRETPPPLATPYAVSPASGICPEVPAGETASVDIYPDIPSPRCLLVKAEQHMALTNRSDEVLIFRLGHIEGQIQPGHTYLVEESFGSYLLPGVHVVQVSPYSGPEIFLVEE